MFVKVVKGNKSDTFPCAHVQITTVTEESAAAKSGLDVPGIRIELSKGLVIRLPEDGDVAFIMNDGGTTVDCVRWPPRQGEREQIQREAREAKREAINA